MPVKFAAPCRKAYLSIADSKDKNKERSWNNIGNKSVRIN